jgi:hypothetical protein
MKAKSRFKIVWRLILHVLSISLLASIGLFAVPHFLVRGVRSQDPNETLASNEKFYRAYSKVGEKCVEIIGPEGSLVFLTPEQKAYVSRRHVVYFFHPLELKGLPSAVYREEIPAAQWRAFLLEKGLKYFLYQGFEEEAEIYRTLKGERLVETLYTYREFEILRLME